MKAMLNSLTDQILDAQGFQLTAQKRVVDQLVSALCEITDLELHPAIFLDENATLTAKGKAVSMTTAAQCAEEFMRTQVFLRGVFQAIQDQLDAKKSVQILYAGTGPFGLLLLPLLHRFSSKQVQITLIDIHSESISALNRVIDALAVREYIDNVACADALSWSPNNQKTFDLIISETMKAMLRQEPQLSIISHLISYLDNTGEIIPQSIDIRLSLCQESIGDINIGTIFTLNKASAKAIGLGDLSSLSGERVISEYHTIDVAIKFYTDIQVYGENRLKENYCSLTIPEVVYDAKPIIGETISYYYTIDDNPGFSFNWKDMGVIYSKKSVPGFFELSAQGIPYLNRFWYLCQLNKNNIQQSSREFSDVGYYFLNHFSSEFNQVLSAAYQSKCVEEFESVLINGKAEKELETLIVGFDAFLQGYVYDGAEV